jgi:hypothetical protein
MPGSSSATVNIEKVGSPAIGCFGYSSFSGFSWPMAAAVKNPVVSSVAGQIASISNPGAVLQKSGLLRPAMGFVLLLQHK